jgi:hypothetical protein
MASTSSQAKSLSSEPQGDLQQCRCCNNQLLGLPMLKGQPNETQAQQKVTYNAIMYPQHKQKAHSVACRALLVSVTRDMGRQ